MWFIPIVWLFCSCIPGYPGLSSPQKIDQISSVVQQLLQQHVHVSRPQDVMHYSRLLMCLPSLYSTNGKMFEALFCQHIIKDMDMEVYLKELVWKTLFQHIIVNLKSSLLPTHHQGFWHGSVSKGVILELIISHRPCPWWSRSGAGRTSFIFSIHFLPVLAGLLARL